MLTFAPEKYEMMTYGYKEFVYDGLMCMLTFASEKNAMMTYGHKEFVYYLFPKNQVGCWFIY